MLDIIITEHEGQPDRHLLYKILETQLLILIKLDTIMSEATDLQTLVDQLKQAQAATKSSLDAANASLEAIKTGIGTIVKGIPSGGLSADEAAALKASLTEALTTEQANQAEAATTASAAGDDAAAVAAAQPATPAQPAA